MKHILSVDQFSKDDLNDLLDRAMYHYLMDKIGPYQLFKMGYPNLRHGGPGWVCNQVEQRYYPTWVAGKILTNLFYEPSTRTSSSFHSAMLRLGGQVIAINDVNYSSVAKGETLEDTIRTIQCYSHVIVLRHRHVGAAARATTVAEVPIINAGDGVGEHPTQALLDLMTILIEKSWKTGQPIEEILNGLTITMMGDLKNGRTVKSLAKLLTKFGIDHINWVSPDELRVPPEFVVSGDIETADLNEVIESTDVLYLTRVQIERMNLSMDDREAISESYRLTPEHMAKAKPNMVLMHPLPRVKELPVDFDSDPRSAYFRQMKYGLFMRMAVLETVLENA